MRTLLIDGDIVVYQVASAVERPAIDFGDGVFSAPTADLKEAQGRADDYIHMLQMDLKADAVVVALKDEENFRKKLCATYKLNRAQTRPPMIRPHLHAYLGANYTAFQRPGLEGDDILGILATSTKIVKGEKVVVSIDKDLRTVPGLHYNPQKPDLGIEKVSEKDADYRHMMQTLTGDPTDGYPGCPGVGPVKAAKILLDGTYETAADMLKDMWPRVVAAYAKAGFGEDYALLQARLARILRVSDYDFKKKEVILWQPPR